MPISIGSSVRTCAKPCASSGVLDPRAIDIRSLVQLVIKDKPRKTTTTNKVPRILGSPPLEFTLNRLRCVSLLHEERKKRLKQSAQSHTKKREKRPHCSPLITS